MLGGVQCILYVYAVDLCVILYAKLYVYGYTCIRYYMRVYHDKIYGKNNKYNCPSNNNNNKYIMAQFSSFSFRPKIRARSYWGRAHLVDE